MSESQPAAPGEKHNGESGSEAGDSSQSESDIQRETMEFVAPSPEAIAPIGPVRPALPASFGRYAVQSVLGQGGFGTVYLGQDTQLDRAVAIKALRGGAQDAEEAQQFLQEARRLARLNHPGIVTIHDVGMQHGQLYIVSEFIPGTSLRAWLTANRPTWQQAVRIVAALADALAHAHAQVTIHRDVKPANILLKEDQTPVLVDFGLGLDESAIGSTELGLISGTPTYMSPEQVTGSAHRIDGRTDIYSLGVVLYELLCRRPPFRASSTQELVRQVRDDDPQPPRQLVGDIPRELERICLKAMSKRMQDRYTTAGDFAEQLRRVLAHGDSVIITPPGATNDAPLGPTVAKIPAVDLPPSGVVTPPPLRGDTPSSSFQDSTPSAVRRARAAERRQVTILSCGAETFQSEEFLERLDDEDQIEVFRKFQQTCEGAITRFGGTVLQSSTEGIVACFGYPIAHEDAARRAARAARAALEGVDKLNQTIEPSHKLKISAWLSIHTGSAVTEMTTSDTVSVVGEARNVAARLEDLAESGVVLCTEATHRLIHGYFECESLGRHKIKGISQPVDLHRVKAETGARSAIDVALPVGLTPLTGRDHEVSLLRDRWEQAQEGMGQIVLVVGEAGLGKSRLVYTIRQQIEEERGAASSSRVRPAAALASHPASAGATSDRNSPIVEWRCLPHYQNSTLHPVVDFFERFLAFGREETPHEKLAKIVNHLEELDLAEPDVVPLFASLLSLPLQGPFVPLNLSPIRHKERTLEAIQLWLRAYASRQPVLFIIEDLHWLDASSLEFLTNFVHAGLNDSVLTLLTFRPEFKTPWPALAHQTSLALTRLTRRQIAEMMRKKSGVENIPDAVVEQVVDRTSGVPLFVEEFTRMIQELGVLKHTPDDSTRVRALALHEIPATLQDLVMARLDRIDSDKEVIQLGATLGREFSHELLAAVSPLDEATLAAELGKLLQAELLYQKGRPPKCIYIFKHALLEDASYNSIVKSKRQQFHKQIGEVLEARFPEIVETQPELLAYHFTEARETRKGVDYWLKAALRSRARSAEIEAIGQLTSGLELVGTLEESLERDGLEMPFQAQLGTAYLMTHGYAAPEVGPCFRRARELCEKLAAAAGSEPSAPEPEQLTETFGGAPTDTPPDPTVRSAAPPTESQRASATAAESRRQLQSQLFAIMWGTWAWHVVRGDFRLCMDLAAEAMELARKLSDPGITMEALFLPGLTMLYRADFTGVRNHCGAAVEDFDDRERTRFWSVHTGQNSGVTHRCYLSLALWHLGYPDQALAMSRAMVELARAVKHPFSLAYAMHHTAWLHQHCRLGAETQAAGEEEIQIATEQGFAFWHATGTLYRAGGLLQQCRLGEALPLIQKGLSAYTATGAGLALPFYHSILGDAYTQAGRFDEALHALDDGIAIADKNDDWFQYAELHRLKGELALARTPPNEPDAESLFRRAIEIARQQKSKSFELRATMSLCRLWQRRGRRDDARRLLAQVFGSFTEGFGTPDLVAAKALLAELG
jgi:serine/threonine protein kinase/predicted ATPase